MNARFNSALILLDRALEEIETGFVPCNTCGDQEDTKNLDFVDDLKTVKSELVEIVNEEVKEEQDQLYSFNKSLFINLLNNAIKDAEPHYCIDAGFLVGEIDNKQVQLLVTKDEFDFYDEIDKSTLSLTKKTN